MKKTPALVLILAMVFIFTACAGNDETTSGKEVKTGIIIEYDSNWLFNKYEVKVSVDDSAIGTLKQGEKELYELTLTEGAHTLTISEVGNDKNIESKEFEVLADNYYYFFIKAESDGIEIQKTDTMTLDSAHSFVGKSAQEGWTKETFLELSFDVPVDWRKESTDGGVKFYPTSNSSDGFLYTGVREIGITVNGDTGTKKAAIDSYIEAVKNYDGYLDGSTEYDLEIAGHYAAKQDSAWKDYSCVYYYIVTDKSLYLVGIDITESSPDNIKDILDNVVDNISIDETNGSETSNDLAGDGSQAIYEDAVGKPAIDIFNELEGLGYKVSFKHAVSKMDFTSVVQFESDPEDTESYTPWIITGVDSYSATSKTVSFFINTQEMMDEAQSKSAAKDALQAKLDASSAWGAVDYYGNREYPYGFKLKIATGMLAETAEDENTWFLKAQCEVKNAYGTWADGVCEARVSGTTESPQIDYFYVY